MNSLPIRTETGPGGEILHLVPYLPAALPSVTRRDLEQAWGNRLQIDLRARCYA